MKITRRQLNAIIQENLFGTARDIVTSKGKEVKDAVTGKAKASKTAAVDSVTPLEDGDYVYKNDQGDATPISKLGLVDLKILDRLELAQLLVGVKAFIEFGVLDMFSEKAGIAGNDLENVVNEINKTLKSLSRATMVEFGQAQVDDNGMIHPNLKSVSDEHPFGEFPVSGKTKSVLAKMASFGNGF